jgi:formate hydrogenlyase subunit 3/multisubunit Na+/H+ antiporter MnhD subunit
LRLGGAAMVVAGGAFAFAQRRFGRLMGYAVIADIGAALLALSLNTAEGLQAALAILAVRGIGLAVWGLGLSWLNADLPQRNTSDFDELAGQAWRKPFAAVAVVLGGLSLAGFPLTAGFAARWALYRQLAVDDLALALVLLIASGSVALAYVRGLAALFRRVGQVDNAPNEAPQEGQAAMVFLAIGIGAILLVGLFPQVLLPAVARVAARWPTGDIHVVLDNLNIHKGERWQRFNERHGGRFHLHYTPLHASWVNQIEMLFGVLARRCLRRKSFRSTEELAANIMAFIARWNERDKKPFRWTFDGGFGAATVTTEKAQAA